MSLRLRAPLVMQTTRLLEGGSGLAEHDGIPSQAKDKIDPTPMREYVEDLWGSKMTIATDQNRGVRPMVSQIRQQPDQDHGIFGASRASPWPQVGRDEGVRGPFENEKRQITMVLIVMIIERKLLLAMRGIVGVVDIEDNGGGRLGVAGDAVVHQGPCEPIEVFAVHLMLQPGEGGSTREVVLGLHGTPLYPQFEHRVMAEMIGVIRIGISRGDLIHALG